jgi:hypothetical protein
VRCLLTSEDGDDGRPSLSIRGERFASTYYDLETNGFDDGDCSESVSNLIDGL